MKKVLLIFLFVQMLVEVSAQTNTFPATGNVGIGTTSPTNMLHVKSGTTSSWIAIDKPVNYEGGLQFQRAGTTLFYLYSDNTDNDALKIQSAASLPGEDDSAPRIHIPYTNKNLYFVQSGGSVAMGHNNPYSHSRLHIKAPTAYPWGIVAEASSNQRIVGLGHDGTSGYVSSSYLGTAGYSALGFRTGDQTRMIISETGNVGIGPASPDAKLDIFGTGGATVDLRVNGRISTGDAGNAGGIWVSTSNNLFVGQQGTTSIGFYNNGAWRLIADNSGRIGIGTASPDQKLTVKGKIHAEEVIIDLSVPAPDYVFEKSYELKSLDEVKKFIDENKHLPEVPSAKEMEKDGVKVGEMEMVLLKKIEELTLYVIELKSENVKVNETLRKVTQELTTLKQGVK